MKTMLVKTFMLVAMIAACSTPALAQEKNESKQIPEGKWVLDMEYVQAANGGCSHDLSEEYENHQHVEVNLDGIELYTELQVKRDSMSLISSKSTLRSKYVYSDKMDGLFFDSSTIPFSPGGKLVDNRLYVQQQVADPLNKANVKYLSLSYELKK